MCKFWQKFLLIFLFLFLLLSGEAGEWGGGEEGRGAYQRFPSVGKRRGFSKGNGSMNIPRVQVSKGEIEAAISPVKNQKDTYF